MQCPDIRKCMQVITTQLVDTANIMFSTYHVASQPILPSTGKLDFLNRQDRVEDYQAPVRI